MKQLLLLTVALLLVTITSGPAPAAAPPLLLGDAPSYQLAGHLEQFIDPSGKLTLGDVLKPAVAARFAPIPGNMNLGYSRDTIWLRFSMQRLASFPEQAYLSLGPPNLDYLTVYLQTGINPTEPGAYRTFTAGDHIPVGAQYAQSSDFLTPFSLAVGQSCTVYLRIRSTSTLILSGAVYTSSAMIRHNNQSILLNGGHLAIALVIVVINLLYYLRLRDPLFPLFALYILSQFITQIGLFGILPLVLPGQAHLIADYCVGCGFGFSCCCISLFAIKLFQLAPGSWYRRFFVCTTLLGGLTVLSVPLNMYGTLASIMIFGLLALMTTMTWLSIRAIRHNEPGGLLYLTAFGISNVVYALQLLRILGIIPAYWWNMHGVQIATLLNMVLMTMALTERLHVAEEKALQAARDTESKAVMLAEEMTVALREKQQKLEEALERQTRFVDMISHEYRTPLAIATATLGIIEQRGREEKAPDEPLRKLGRAVKRMAELFDLVLERSRQDVDVTQVNLSPVNLAEFSSSLVRAARELRPERVIDFRPAVVTTVMVDQGLLGTALLNLLDNADKYSPEESVITLALRTDEHGTILDIRDQGPGFRPEERERVFEKYRRGSASSGTSGAGIGLWLVRAIVTAHGGSVSITDNQPSGAVVTIRLPNIQT